MPKITSKIHDELAKAAGITPESGQNIDDQDYLKNLTRAVAKLSNADWDKLSDDAGEFHNKLAAALNAKKDLPTYPDAKKAAEEDEAPVRRRRAAADDEPEVKPRAKAYEPKKGDEVTVLTKKGKSYTGKITATNDGGELVIDDGQGDMGIKLDNIDTITPTKAVAEEEPAPRRRRAAEDDEPAPSKSEPELDDVVEVKTKRGTVKRGKIVKMTEDDLDLEEADGGILEFAQKNVESITVITKGHVDKTTTGTRRKAAEADDDAGTDKGGKVTKEDNGGVSVTLRIREIMCEDPTDPISLDELGKRIKKEGLVCKDNTLKMVHSDCTKLFGLLKAAKKLK